MDMKTLRNITYPCKCKLEDFYEFEPYFMAHAFIKNYYDPELNVEEGKLLAYRIIK
jgi:hypothetical protein